MDGTQIKKTLGQFDIIFIDPPYHKNLITPILLNLHYEKMMTENGLAIIEYASDEIIELTDHFKEIKKRKMGDATFSILEYRL